MPYIYYSIIFYFIIFALLIAQVKEEKDIRKIKKASVTPFVILLVLILVRIGFAYYYYGHPYDIKCFTLWAERLAALGPAHFYAPDYFADYPPGYMLVLYLLGMIGKIFHIPTESNFFAMLIKMPSILADGVLGYMIYQIAKVKMGEKNATVLLFLFLFNPVLILNSAFWGQIDSFFTLFLFAALYLLYQKKYISSVIFYTICALIKPQAFIFAPIFLCVFLENKDLSVTLKAAGASFLTVILASLPFYGIHLELLFQKYMDTLGSYSYATVNAYNIYALMGLNWFEIQGPIWSIWSMLVLVAISLFSIWFYIKATDKHKMFYMAYLLIVSVFTISTKMHERYIFPALILIFICYLFKRDKRLLWLLLAQTVAQLMNTGLVFMDAVSNNTTATIASVVLMAVISLLNVLILIYSVKWGIQIYVLQALPTKAKMKKEKIILPEEGKYYITKKDIAFMLAITVIYGLIACYNLGDRQAPQTFYPTTEKDVILDLKAIKPVGKLMLYEGIGNSEAKLSFEVSSDGAKWQPLALETDNEKNNTLTFSPSFNWKEYQATAEARFIKLSSSLPGQMIGEIGAFSPDDLQYTLFAPNGESQLVDEQAVVPLSPSYLNSTYFDEIYHARTAYEITNGLPIYETTHPPLGKVIMSWGVMLFGMTPFGYRIMGTIFGALMLPVLYIMLKKMFGKSNLALGGSILFAADFMHFSLTRMATIDSFVTLFIMLSYLFMLYYFTSDFYKMPLKKAFIPLGLCGVFFGLAASTKWIGLYAAIGLAVLLAVFWGRAYWKHKMDRHGEYKDYMGRQMKTIAFCVIFFIMVPSLLYFCSYLPQMQYDKPEGKSAVTYIWDNQVSMLHYHGGDVVTQTHPFSSRWYSWFVVGRPLWAYTGSSLAEGVASTITIMGNPFVWWVGLLSMLSMLGWFAWRDRRALFLLIAYLAQLLPWVFVERTTFIYHYFSCVPFMIIATCYIIEYIKGNYAWTAKYIKYYYLLTILLFIVFYPALSGLEVPQTYILWLRWFPSWAF